MPISSLLIKPAGPDCNLACGYCFYRPAGALYPEAPHPRMSLEVLRELVRQYMALARGDGGRAAIPTEEVGDTEGGGRAARPTGEAGDAEGGGRAARPTTEGNGTPDTPVGPAAFCWQGGEPTLMGIDFYRTVIALQKKYGLSGQVVANSLQTNGLLIDDEWARLLARYRFLVGVSLDGPSEVHDHYRRNHAGAESLVRVLRGLKALQRNHVECNALCMVTSLSASKAALVWEFLRAQKLDYLQFIPCLEKRPGSEELAEFTITPEQYGSFLCEVFELWLPEREQVHVRIFDDLLADLLGMPETKTCELRPRCGDYLVVEHNGDVYDCDFFVQPDHRVGNLMQQPLAELAEAEPFAAFAAAKSEYSDQCQGCEWLSLCCGGCQKHRLFGHGCLAAPSYLCAGYRQLFAHAIPRLQEIAARWTEMS